MQLIKSDSDTISGKHRLSFVRQLIYLSSSSILYSICSDRHFYCTISPIVMKHNTTPICLVSLKMRMVDYWFVLGHKLDYGLGWQILDGKCLKIWKKKKKLNNAVFCSTKYEILSAINNLYFFIHFLSTHLRNISFSET